MLLLAPELEALEGHREALVDCGSCVMLAEHAGTDPEQGWSFNPDTRCCTFHPTLPNYLLGRALRRGGVSEERVRARLASGGAISAWGMAPPEGWNRRESLSKLGFGRDESCRCPFWVGGELSCGIWEDRNAVCRTWYCKHDHGLSGALRMQQAKMLLTEVEQRLGMFCLVFGEPPRGEVAVEDWVTWFVWCAERIDAMTPAEAELLRDDGLTRRQEALAGSRARTEPVAEVLVASPSGVHPDGDRYWVFGYSRFDGLLAPRSIFQLLSRLDGRRPWREALAEANLEAEPPLSETLVAALFRIGAVRSPLPGDVREEGEASLMLRISADGAPLLPMTEQDLEKLMRGFGAPVS